MSNVRKANAVIAPSVRLGSAPGLGQVVAGAAAAPPRPGHLTVLDAPSRPVMTWQQAQAALQAHTIAQELKAASEKLSQKRVGWTQQLAELRARNEAADVTERLPEDEFIMDRELRGMLREEGEQRVTAVRAASVRACVEPQVVRGRLEPEFLKCTGSNGHKVLMPLPEHAFLSTVSGEDLKRWREAAKGASLVLADGVASFPVHVPTAEETARLRKVSFLRRVEQEEWRERSRDQRGQMTTVKRWHGQMAARIDLSSVSVSNTASLEPTPRTEPGAASLNGAATANASQQGASQGGAESMVPEPDEDDETEDEDGLPRKRSDDDNIQGNEVENGLCKLLYSSLQLHCPTRKAAQAILLMEEYRAVQRAFNARFEQLRARKAADVDKLDERASRIEEIQKDLSSGAPDRVDYAASPQEAWQDALAVQDQEVKVEKWVSEEERARRAAEALAEEEARRKAEADDARQRALREMMNATLEIKKLHKEDEALKRQPWMDLPRAQLTAEQRLQLVEWEKRAAEAAEEAEKARRALETERKGLEFEMADIIMEFNNQLVALAHAKTKVSIELRVLEAQALDCALSWEGAYVAQRAVHDLKQRQAAAVDTLEWRRALVSEASRVRHLAAVEYENLSAQERALDKAVKREMGMKDEDLWEAVQRVYKDRTRPPRPGAQGRSVQEILGKLPEAAQLPSPSPQGHGSFRRSFTGELLPQTSTLDPPPAEPPCSMQLQRWLARHGQHAQTQEGGAQSHVDDGVAAVDAILRRLQANRHARARWQGLEGAGAASTGPQAGQTSPAARAQSPAGKRRPGTASLTPPGTAAGQRPGTADAAGSGHGMLQSLLNVLGRPLGPLLDVMAQGQSLRGLVNGDSSNLCLVPPDAEDLLDPYQSPLARHVFSPTGPLGAPQAATPAPSSGAQSPLQGSPLPPRHQGEDRGHHHGPRSPQHLQASGPYTLADKIPDMEEVWWLRLMDMRDARIALEQSTDATWSQLAWASLTCDLLATEEVLAAEDLSDISEALSVLPNVAFRSLIDVGLLYRLKNGQLEVPVAGDPPLDAMRPAVLLHRWQVEQRNLTIQESGADKVAVLRDLKVLATAIHLARWGVSRAELREQHAKSELTDLQLLHVTKDLQAVLRDRAALSRMDGVAKMEARIAAATASHAARLALKMDQCQRVEERVVVCMREHQDLQGATVAAQAAADEAKRVRAVIARSAAEDEAAHKRALRAIVANSQLKDIAAAQAAEIQLLQLQLEQMKTRTFPMLSPSSAYQSPTALAPDLRFPRTPSPTARLPVGAPRPYSVPAGKSRPMYGTSLTDKMVGAGLAGTRPASGTIGGVRSPGSVTRVMGNGVAGVTRVGSARKAAAAMEAAAAGQLPPRPGTVATGSRRYDRQAS